VVLDSPVREIPAWYRAFDAIHEFSLLGADHPLAQYKKDHHLMMLRQIAYEVLNSPELLAPA
jgi:hypothetical protein